MKKFSAGLLFFFFVGIGFSAEPVIEFRGVMVGDGATKLSLVDKTSDTTRWVEIGQVFMGYTIKGYDVATETATLTRVGKDYRIRLNTAKILEAPSEPLAAPAPAPKTPEQISRAVLNNLRQIAAAADQYMLENGKPVGQIADLVGPSKYIKRLISVDGEDYARISPGDNKHPLSITTQSGVSVSYTP